MKIYKIASSGIYWHGTEYTPNFKAFNIQGNSYLGIYASSSKEYAETFGEHLIRLQIDIGNPFVINMGDRSSPNYATTQGEIRIGNKMVGFYRKLTPEVVSLLKSKGYDGIEVEYNGVKGFEVVAFDPNQVKILEVVKSTGEKT